MKDVSKKVAYYGCLTGLSLLLSYVESLLPAFFGVPGAKIGLANLVTVFALYTGSPQSALCVNFLRLLLSGLLFGNLFSILYSAAGCLLSFAVMFLLKKTEKFGIPAVSAAGGVFHNLGQLFVAALLAGKAVLSYFPYLFLCGVLSGIVIGIAGGIIVQRLKNVIK